MTAHEAFPCKSSTNAPEEKTTAAYLVLIVKSHAGAKVHWLLFHSNQIKNKLKKIHRWQNSRKKKYSRLAATGNTFVHTEQNSWRLAKHLFVHDVLQSFCHDILVFFGRIILFLTPHNCLNFPEEIFWWKFTKLKNTTKFSADRKGHEIVRKYEVFPSLSQSIF